MKIVDRILETALYCSDLDRSVAFFRDLLGCRVMDQDQRFASLDAGAGTVLLLFREGGSTAGVTFPAGSIPPHDGSGPVHMAFAVQPGSIEEWAAQLQAAGVEVESRVNWSRGGVSLYFRDPDGHSIELATPGVWAVY